MALYLGENKLTPQELKDRLLKDGIKNVVKGLPKDTVNTLLNISSLL